MRCPFCGHEMDVGHLDGAGLRGWRTYLPVAWKPADRQGGDRRQPPGFFRRRSAWSCAACGALVLTPTGGDT